MCGYKQSLRMFAYHQVQPGVYRKEVCSPNAPLRNKLVSVPVRLSTETHRDVCARTVDPGGCVSNTACAWCQPLYQQNDRSFCTTKEQAALELPYVYSCAPLQPSARQLSKGKKWKRSKKGTGMSPREVAECLKIEDDVYCQAQWCFSTPEHLSTRECKSYL